MNTVSLIGFIAAACTTFATVPQMIKVFKSKQTQDISLYMYIIMTTGIFLWLVYGLFINDLPLIVANGVSLIFASTILTLKIKYK